MAPPHDSSDENAESDSDATARRKTDHLALVSSGRVSFRDKTTLLECVDLLHDALPELSLDEVDLRTTLIGKTLRAPFLIAGMTGGTAEAREINRALAGVAESLGIAFGLGSQRPMIERPELAATYDVRDIAPNVLLFGNLGLAQAAQMSTEAVRELTKRVGCDALAIHLNPAQELVQPGGDRDFRGGLTALRRLTDELSLPIIVKETGAGISPQTAQKLAHCNVRWCDVGGAGGTSWVAVEAKRAVGQAAELGQKLWDWGVPTAVSIVAAKSAGISPIATGGLRDGYDAARAISLGAELCGFAAVVLTAYRIGGAERVAETIQGWIAELRSIALLTGSARPSDMGAMPRKRIVRGNLREWLTSLDLSVDPHAETHSDLR